MRQRPARQWRSNLVEFQGVGSVSSPIDAVSIPRPPRSTESVTYSPSSLSLSVGVPMTPAVPAIVGTPPRYIHSRPALPNGLKVDEGTGTISGTPTTLQPATPYTIIALSGDDPTLTQITIEVV